MRFLCAGNWKLHKTPSESLDFLQGLLDQISMEDQKNLVLLPPATSLAIFSEKLQSTSLGYGAQNIYFENSGAFTGETSPKVVAELGAEYCLVGHSERREHFNESDRLVAQKIKAVQNLNMTPILCIGENLEQREKEQTEQVLGEQLLGGLSLAETSRPLVIAYEPVWAIGTDRAATESQAESVHIWLRDYLSKSFSQEFAQKTLLLYGGSVKPSNALGLARQKNIDGFLVGGASLNIESFYEIFNHLKSVYSS